MVILLAAAPGAAAQEVLSSPAGTGAGDLPPTLDLTDELPGGESIEPMAQSEFDDEMDAGFGHPYGGHDGHAAHLAGGPLFESSGTWLRRGFWYAEGDYVLMNKSWDRKGLPFAFEGTVGSSPGTSFGQVGFGPVLAMNFLTIDGSKPGADGLARVSLGRFLFRDGSNRDHVAQFTFYGGGQWKQSSSLDAATATGLQVNDYIDRVNPSWDGARNISFNYDTGYDSGEINYLVKSRMGRDQMVLQPSGDWVRTANKTLSYSFLAGVRYVNLTELLTMTAERDPDVATTEGGDYFIETDNDLFGGQFGGGVAHETSRWSIGLNVKGGAFWNRMDLHSQFTAGTAANVSTGATDSTEDNLSFVGELQLLGKWHLRPNVSLRAGFELLYIESVALAPHQINFVPGGYSPIASAGEVVGIGSSIGLEAYR